MLWVWMAILLYVCLGLGILSAQMTRKTFFKQWNEFKAWEKALSVLIIPALAIYEGFQWLVFILAAALFNGEVGFDPPDEDEGANRE